MAGDTGMAGKVALLLWAQTLGLAGAQTTQLLVEPPWRPAVPWDRVTLTCQGLGTTGATTWYRDGQRWWLEGPDHFTVTESGSYECDRPGSPLVLQVPARPLLEGDTVKLRCQCRWDLLVTEVRFYRGNKELIKTLPRTELSLSPLHLHHSGRYRCRVWVNSGVSRGWQESAPVTVTVHEVLLSGVSVSAQPPGGQVALGDCLVLSCAVAAGTGPLSFTWHRGGSGTLLGTGPNLELRRVGDNDSGQYHCRVSDGDIVAESDPLNVTVLGDPVTLRCLVQVGSAPVTFTWLHNGQEVARGPVMELGKISVEHSGTYQCMATNELGQDGHRVFRALSAELALEVTPDSPWVTAVAVNVGRTLLFLFLLLAVIGGCHCWHHWAARTPQDRTPPEEGAVQDPHVMGTEQTGVHACAGFALIEE
ncbi:Fc receptor-like protein 2 [Chamaea fasciata]|uniref:Fc receptor-like protein 2 n=1 Tax=Chamaea fasciata TaxID=190680 RepID=UPI00336AD153